MNRFEITRKDFLLFLLSLAVAPWSSRRSALAFPMSQVLGPASNGYLSEYWRRLHQMHCSHFFDFSRAFTRLEQEYFDYCRDQVTDWGLELAPNALISNFIYSHRLSGGRIFHGRITLGCGVNQQRATMLAQKVLRHRGIQTDIKDFFSLGWDFDRDRFKIYSLQRETSADQSSDFHSQSLQCLVYEKNKLVDHRKVRFMKIPSEEILRKIPFSAAIVSASVSLSEVSEKHFNLRLKQFHASLLSPQSKKIADLYDREFALNPFFIRWESPLSHTIYYP